MKTVSKAALLGSIVLAGAASANPFVATTMAKGYQTKACDPKTTNCQSKQATASCGGKKASASCGATATKKADAKCGEAKCGAKPAKTTKKAEAKCGEAKCGASK